MLSNQGKAEYQRSLQQASQIKALAEAEAEKVARIGIAQAMATEEQVRAYGGPQFQVTQQVMNRFAEAIQQSRVDVVPRVLVGGGGGAGDSSSGGTGSIIESLMALLLSEKMGVKLEGAKGEARTPEVDALRQQIRQSLQKPEEPKQAGGKEMNAGEKKK